MKIHRPIISTAALTLLAAAATAQPDDCTPRIVRDVGLIGVQVGEVFASTTYDPDGPGPASPRVIIGGTFGGGSTGPGLAVIDGLPLTSFPSQLRTPSAVKDLDLLPNGDLVIAGQMLTTASVPTISLNLLGRWDGTAWHPIGSTNATGTIEKIAVAQDGEIFAFGQFGISGTGIVNVGRFNGAMWVGLPNAGLTSFSSFNAVTPDPNGGFILGGSFRSAAQPALRNIIRWTGGDNGAWESVSGGVGSADSNARINDLAWMPDGRLVAVGKLRPDTAPGTVVAILDENGWSELNPGIAGITELSAVGVDSTGRIFAGTAFPQNNPGAATLIMRDTDGSWSTVATFNPDSAVRTIEQMPDGSMLIGGRFTQVTHDGITEPANRLVRFGAPTPAITAAPRSTVVCARGPAVFTVAADSTDATYSWQIEDPAFSGIWRPLTDGAGDLVISGSTTPTLTIAAAVPFNGNTLPRVRALVSNNCGTTTSRPVRTRLCPADWDCSGGVDGDDITAFFNDWQTGNGDADMSGGTDGDDITSFFAAWQRGACYFPPLE